MVQYSCGAFSFLLATPCCGKLSAPFLNRLSSAVFWEREALAKDSVISRVCLYRGKKQRARGPNQITMAEESRNFRPRGFAPVKVTRFTKFTNERSQSFDRVYCAVTAPTTTTPSIWDICTRCVPCAYDKCSSELNSRKRWR